MRHFGVVDMKYLVGKSLAANKTLSSPERYRLDAVREVVIELLDDF
jgi:hypothetical protein